MATESDRSQLSPTSFALLGLLRDRPMSAYELVRYMERSVLNLIWRRHVSGIYAEPKKLLKLGLVEGVRSEGERGQTYRITSRGIEALEEWIAAHGPSNVRLEDENLIRLLFSRESSVADFRELLDDLTALAVHPGAPEAIERFKRGEFEFANRIHLTAAIWQLRSDINQALVDWATRMKEASAEWADLQPSADKTVWAQEVFEGIGERFAAWQGGASLDVPDN